MVSANALVVIRLVIAMNVLSVFMVFLLLVGSLRNLLSGLLCARSFAGAIAGRQRAENPSDNRTDECCDPERQEVSVGAKEKLGDPSAHYPTGRSPISASK